MDLADARVYDDFDLTQTTLIEGLWRTYLFAAQPSKEAYWEVRQSVSQGSGGTLIASGTMRVTVIRTGRVAFQLAEFQARGRLEEPLELSPGRYWTTLAPIAFGTGMCFASETSGLDAGPSSDPNPPVTGGPIRNTNAFFDCPELKRNYQPINDDVSWGVGTLTTVATTLSLADSFAITRGAYQSGGLEELWGADDERLVVQQRMPAAVSHPDAQVVADTATPVPPRQFGGNRVILTVESRCSAFPVTSVVERIEMYDFQAQRWVVISEQAAASADRQTVIDRTGEFIEAGTNRLMARVSWLNFGSVSNLNWSGQVDRILWEVMP